MGSLSSFWQQWETAEQSAAQHNSTTSAKISDSNPDEKGMSNGVLSLRLVYNTILFIYLLIGSRVRDFLELFLEQRMKHLEDNCSSAEGKEHIVFDLVTEIGVLQYAMQWNTATSISMDKNKTNHLSLGCLLSL